MVPRATDNALVDQDLAIAKRCAFVRATIGDGVEFPAGPEDRDVAPACLHGDAFAFRNFINFADNVFLHDVRGRKDAGRVRTVHPFFDINYEFQ
jgi:hypothetical protein